MMILNSYFESLFWIAGGYFLTQPYLKIAQIHKMAVHLMSHLSTEVNNAITSDPWHELGVEGDGWGILAIERSDMVGICWYPFAL